MLHSDVLDCAVVGITVPNTADEAPRAYIVKRPDSQLNAAEINTFMSIHLAKYKILDGGVVFTDSIPRGPTGKVLRKVLKERAEQEVKAEFKAAFVKNFVLSAITRFEPSEAIAVEGPHVPVVAQSHHVESSTSNPGSATTTDDCTEVTHDLARTVLAALPE